jgi:hypothetical protein
MTGLARRAWLLVAGATILGCGVPKLAIIESADNSQRAEDAGVMQVEARGPTRDAGIDAASGPSAPAAQDRAPERHADEADSGRPSEPTGRAEAAGGAGMAAVGGGPSGGSGGNAGAGGSSQPAQAGGLGATAPGSCVEWKPANPKDAKPPEFAIEGGHEDTLSAPAREYVCRVKPGGSSVAVPGKVIFGSGCFVVYRGANGKLATYGAMNEPIEVLTAAAGCSYEWKSASVTALAPAGLEVAQDAADSTYVCRGYNPGVLAQGTHIGHTYPSTDKPGQTQCWFELLGSPTLPQEPTKFEMLTFERR